MTTMTIRNNNNNNNSNNSNSNINQMNANDDDNDKSKKRKQQKCCSKNSILMSLPSCCAWWKTNGQATTTTTTRGRPRSTFAKVVWSLLFASAVVLVVGIFTGSVTTTLPTTIMNFSNHHKNPPLLDDYIKSKLELVKSKAASTLSFFHRYPIPRFMIEDYQDPEPPTHMELYSIRRPRDSFTECPPQYFRRAYVDLNDDTNLRRAYQYHGYLVSSNKDDLMSGTFFILYKKKGHLKGLYVTGKPWQRYSKIPGFAALESKDQFAAGFHNFLQKYLGSTTPQHNDFIYFLPETYRLKQISDRNKVSKVLKSDYGKHRPWVLKQVNLNNGKGVQILEPDSPKLYKALDKALKDTNHTYVLQSYICNELTWFGGEKFDLRFFWMVVSIDPLIVLYQDGYVRVGGALYNETDFTTSGQHLTNHAFRRDDDDRVTADDLWRRVRQHYQKDQERLSKRLPQGITDPVDHIRNQMKEAISTTALAFQETLTIPKVNVSFDNLFGFYGADFIVDADLDVHFVEAQISPGMGQKQDFRIDVFRRLFRPMVTLVEEVYWKQVHQQNLWPLETIGDDWQVVFVENQWRYRYKGYQRDWNNKAGCGS